MVSLRVLGVQDATGNTRFFPQERCSPSLSLRHPYEQRVCGSLNPVQVTCCERADHAAPRQRQSDAVQDVRKRERLRLALR
jgi:hypothetical protein